MYISDHKTVCIDLNLPKLTILKTTFICRQFRKIDLYEFNKDIATAFSNTEHLDFDSLVQFFYTTLTFIIDKHGPLKTVTVTPQNSNLRFTPNLLIKRCKRRYQERTWRNSRNEADGLFYKNQCLLYNYDVKKTQSNHFSSLFKNCSDFKSL